MGARKFGEKVVADLMVSPGSRRSRPRRGLVVLALLATTASACVGGGDDGGDDGDQRAQGSWPTAPPVKVCGNQEILGNGPAEPPKGAVVVPAGDNSKVDFSRAGETYWFAPGRHTLGPGEFTQIIPGDNSRFVGASGAVLDGQKENRYAFTQRAEGVTIEYLTIQNFGPVGGNPNEGVVNHDSGDNWTIRYNTIRGNAGAGVMMGSGSVVQYNCITRNEQYGFNAYSPGGPVGITLDHNELSFNNTYDWEAEVDGCGCTGGGKFWSVTNARVTNNYVHHNKSVGLWADNNNRGFLFENNYIADNADVGILFETSYNALIRHNSILRNALVAGPKNPGFPTGGVYISESGADARVKTAYRNSLEITENVFRDNWSGVVLWENADRYCGSPANTSTGECTLVNPEVVTATSCNPENISTMPYYEDCRWKTQNVKVHHNTFEHDPAAIGGQCTFQSHCGVSAIISNFGSYPSWSPYHGRVVEQAVAYRQNNTFYDNTYQGSWRFVLLEQGNLVSFAEWRSAPYVQDVGSLLGPLPHG